MLLLRRGMEGGKMRGEHADIMALIAPHTRAAGADVGLTFTLPKNVKAHSNDS